MITKFRLLFSIFLICICSLAGAQNHSESVNSVLWKITSNNSKKTSYLLGSVHIFGDKWLDSWKIIDSLVTKQELFISEHTINLQRVTPPQILQPAAKPLKAKDFFGDDLAYVTSHFAKNYRVDIIKYIDTNKNSTALLPEFTQLLQNDYLYHKGLKASENLTSMDDVLLFSAKTKGIKLIGLDSVAKLDSLFNSSKWINAKAQSVVDLVKEANGIALDARAKQEFEKLDKLVKAYDSGVYTYTNAPVSDNGVKINTRNKFWMTKLPKLLNGNNSFIVVGIEHLTGSTGILQLLKENGFILTPIPLL